MPVENKTNANTRHWIVAIFLQLGIRLRYLYESVFYLVPLFSGSLTSYRSPYRPKNCPNYDYVTHMGFKWIIIVTAFAREYIPVYLFMAYTGILRLLTWLHSFLSARLVAQFVKAGYNEAEREVRSHSLSEWAPIHMHTFLLHRFEVSPPKPSLCRGRCLYLSTTGRTETQTPSTRPSCRSLTQCCCVGS